MKSWEVLREAIERITVKALAKELGVSNALVYKWCQEPSGKDAQSSGARNPLDRVRLIHERTGDARVINWLCHEAGGFYVANPPASVKDHDEELLAGTQRMVHEFGDLLSAVSRSFQNDGRITPDEAEHIRGRWEQLKTTAERMVVACERGLYGQA